MNLSLDEEILKKAESILAELFPSPEEELNSMCLIAGYTPENEEKYVKVRRLTLEIEELIGQTRWHIAQSIIALLINPEIQDIPERDNDEYNNRVYISTGASLLIRPMVANIKKVIFHDPQENRKGKPISGWIFNMMIDNVIFRSIAVLDRIAHVTAIIGDVKFNNDKVYFRKNKIQIIHDKLKLNETELLLNLAKSELLKFLISYRDGFTHDHRQYSTLTGFIPRDMILDKSDQTKTYANLPWVATDLISFTNASYDYILKSLKLTNLIYKIYLPHYHTHKTSPGIT